LTKIGVVIKIEKRMKPLILWLYPGIAPPLVAVLYTILTLTLTLTWGLILDNANFVSYVPKWTDGYVSI